MPKSKRIICYAINGSGLGHLTRLTAIARWLRRYVALLDGRPPEVLFLTSSDASDSLSQAGFAAFKIPSKTVAQKTELNKLEYRRLAKHFVWNTLGVFSPDLFVVDTFPSGSFDELFQVLDGPFKKGFIYRDVKPDYAARPTFRSAINMYDAVVVPHRGDPINLNGVSREESRVPAETHCGEVIQFEREELLPIEQARTELGVASGDRLVYLSAGGGGDANVEENLASLVRALRDEPNVHLLVGAGPLYRGSRMSGSKLTWFDSTNIWRYFSAVDVAVSAAGYNTFHELLFARVPTAFFAQEKIADDQQQRILWAEKLGVCHWLRDVSNQEEVQWQVRELLQPDAAVRIRQGCENTLSQNGARQCAIELLRPLYDQNQLAWASEVLTSRVAHALERISDGSTSALTEWLTQLLPSEHFRSSDRADLRSLLPQLSEQAARELEAVLSNNESSSNMLFEERLVDLLNTIEALDRKQPRETHVRVLADEVLKTLSAAIKKQPFEANADRTNWVTDIMDRVQSLLSLASDGSSACDVLRLYRMFPRIADVDAVESFDLFDRFLDQRRSAGEPTHEVIHQIQVLKMTHQKVTRETLEMVLEGVAR